MIRRHPTDACAANFGGTSSGSAGSKVAEPHAGAANIARSKRLQPEPRRGIVVVLAAFFVVVLMAFAAFAIDVGYLHVARAELQRTADAAALAAGWELVDDAALSGTVEIYGAHHRARERAIEMAKLNPVCNTPPEVDYNEDIQLGYLANFSDEFDFSDPSLFNAVRVRVQRTGERNGDVPLFFGRIFNMYGVELDAEATVAMRRNIGGFTKPPNGKNLNLLPYALDLDTWVDMLEGGGDDNWRWDEDSGTVKCGSDTIREVNLFPQGTGSPGNRGTVNIGVTNNSTSTVRQQILTGITPEQLDLHGGELKFDENGELFLNGNTGISAAVKSDFEAIRGEKRIIPIFALVEGPGNNAEYTIVKFVGVRIMEVKLTGSMNSKRVIVQPANVIVEGALPSEFEESSWFVYSPARLVK